MFFLNAQIKFIIDVLVTNYKLYEISPKGYF
jgi:hypothetical protein